MKWTTLIGIALWAIIPAVIANKKGRAGIGYFFLSFLITPLITMIITLCLKPLNEIDTAAGYLSSGFGNGTNGFSSKEESEFVHNAIANGDTFDHARAEYKRLHDVSDTAEAIYNDAEERKATDASTAVALQERAVELTEEEAVNIETEKVKNKPDDQVPTTVIPIVLLENHEQEGNICPSCGQIIPTDSEFCQYCGTAIVPAANRFVLAEGDSDNSGEGQKTDNPKSPDNKAAAIPASVPTVAIHVNIPDASSVEDIPQPKSESRVASERSPTSSKARYCKKCGGFIDADTRRCSSCKKQYFRPKTAIPIFVLSFVVLVLAGLNIWQFLLGQQASKNIKGLNNDIASLKSSMLSLDATVTSLNSEIAKKDEKISDLNNNVASKQRQINSLNQQIDNLKVPAEEYESICKELKNSNIGYGAYNFNVDKSVIVLRKSDTSKKITLTAYWTYGGSVSVSYSNFNARLTFDNHNWTYSTTMTVSPKYTGATVATFSNNVDSNTFKVLIIVTD